MKKPLMIAAGLTVLLGSGAWAFMGMEREPVVFCGGSYP